ncbi:hypothetical protein TSUD_370770 [Trifolium subterraneum]|uniref:Uncharacterized protein n=1 Tax=Trifolium subterraneum TaxID=3900 RepID=A0A2Z6NID8_TRISU|nr:hypothetical protein TSUD_370770 [Trifolium subterraneum]
MHEETATLQLDIVGCPPNRGGKDGDGRCLVKAEGIGRGDKDDGENHDGGGSGGRGCPMVAMTKDSGGGGFLVVLARKCVGWWRLYKASRNCGYWWW